MHLTNYYNRISYDALDSLEHSAPGFVAPLEDLLRESGHVCAFNTFGGIMLSPEWEGMVGAPKNDAAEIASNCMAMGRALGFGRWSLAELTVGKRVVIRSSSTYESSYYLARHGKASRPREYFFQGAALAIAQLAHRVDWESKPALTQGFYDELFRGGVPWRAEQTKSMQCGDEVSEVVVHCTQ